MSSIDTVTMRRRRRAIGPCSARGVGVRRLLTVLVAAVCLSGVVEATAAELPAPGTKGYGVSVFEGSELERFEVEILGSIEGFGSTGTTILAMLSGAGLEHTGVLQGMSGSPVYVDGELIGAVMSTWSFAKDPIAGIRPIDEMRAIAADVDALPPTEAFAAVDPSALESSGLVWSASGFAPSVLPQMESSFATKLNLAAAGDAAASDGSLEAGDPLAVMLVDGDARLFAVGTVTERIGDTVLGFGHPFLGAGAVSLPMAQAEVVALMASREISFKIARAGAVVGALRLDRRAGIAGVLGQRADTLPVHVRVEGGDHATPGEYDFEVARLRGMTPQLASWTVQSAVADRRALTEDQAISTRVTVSLEDADPIVSEAAFVGGGVTDRLGMEVMLPVGLLENVRGERPRVERVDVDVRIEARAAVASIARTQVVDPVLEPGKTLRARVELSRTGAPPRWEEIELQVPENLAPGNYRLHVTDGATAFSEEIARSAPRWSNLGVEAVREGLALRGRADVLVAVLYGPSRSLLVDGVELENLPPRVGAVLARQYAAPATPSALATPLARAERPLDLVASGAAHLILRTKDAPPRPPQHGEAQRDNARNNSNGANGQRQH